MTCGWGCGVGGCLTVLLMSAIGGGTASPAIGGSAHASDAPPTVEPIVLIDTTAGGIGQPQEPRLGDRKIRGCGIRVRFRDGLTFELTNMKTGTATELVVQAFPASTMPGLRKVWFATSGERTDTMLPIDPRVEQRAGEASSATSTHVTHRGAVDVDAGARLFQQLILGGGTVTIDTGTAQSIHTIPGPLDHTVRTSFLHCSGDLFPRTR